MNIDIKSIKRLIPSMTVLVVAFLFLSVYATKRAVSASLTSASVTLANSRLSFKGKISSGSAGSSLVTIQSGSSDANTNHLFPGDLLCFTDQGENVCRDNTTYTVANIVNSTQFNVTSPLTTALTATDYAVATQAGIWTVTFTTVNTVPINGKLIITIPMADNANGNNGIPDSASSIALGGFDMNKTATASATVTASSCTGGAANWGPAATVITTGYGTNDHTISWTRTSATCAGGSTITVSIAGNGIENPGGMIGKTQGAADVYGVTVATTDGTNTIDSAVPRVAPVEAVLISATVDETLSFAVGAVAASTPSICGQTTTVATTATSVPWGHFAATDTFYYAAQLLTASTNAASGYVVTIQENDQMGKNGNVCTGGSPSSGNYTFSAGTCIRDTTCSAATPCTESVMGDWPAAASYPGLGYSLATQAGTTAAYFFYNQGGRTFNAKQLADKEAPETPATIMSSSGPVSGDGVYVCYKITIPGNQPAGYYYNIAKYTATATF